MFHTPAHKVAPSLPQAGTIEFRPYADDARVIVNQPDDVMITGHGSVWLVSPQSSNGIAWCEEYLSHAQRFGFAYAVEARYIDGVMDGMFVDGLKVA